MAANDKQGYGTPVVARSPWLLALEAVSVLAVMDLVYWAVRALFSPLFWDDAYMLSDARTLIAHPWQLHQWRHETLAHHLPTAFLPHVLTLSVSESHFPLLAHLLQNGALATFCIVAYVACRKRENKPIATVMLGLFASWPLVTAATHEIAGDMLVAVLGFCALLSFDSRHPGRGLCWFGAAALTKLTAVSFLPGAFWLARRLPHARRSTAALIGLGALPFLWIAFSFARGAPSGYFEFYRAQPHMVVKLPLIHGVRHFLELVLYDGRWLVAGALLGALVPAVARASKSQRRLKELWQSTAPLDQAWILSVVAVFGVVTLLTGVWSLQRYLLSLAMPLAWLTAKATVRSRSRLAMLAAGVGIALGIAVSHDAVPVLSSPERALARLLPALGRSIESRPQWIREYTDTYLQAVRYVEEVSPAGKIGAPWMAVVALQDAAFGYTSRRFWAEEWYPGEPTDGFQVLWVDERERGSEQLPEYAWRKGFGRRYRVDLLCRRTPRAQRNVARGRGENNLIAGSVVPQAVTGVALQ